MKKLLVTIISVFLSINVVGVYANEYDSLDVGPTTSTAKKKVMFIDTVNTETRSTSEGCRTGYIQIGISGMPKNSANYTIKSVPRDQYITRFEYYGTYCVFVAAIPYVYSSYNPKWVTSFGSIRLICAPIYSKWN